MHETLANFKILKQNRSFRVANPSDAQVSIDSQFVRKSPPQQVGLERASSILLQNFEIRESFVRNRVRAAGRFRAHFQNFIKFARVAWIGSHLLAGKAYLVLSALWKRNPAFTPSRSSALATKYLIKQPRAVFDQRPTAALSERTYDLAV